MKNNKTETYKEKVEHLCKVTGFEKDRCKEFVTFVWQYLDSCGYFLCDFNMPFEIIFPIGFDGR